MSCICTAEQFRAIALIQEVRPVRCREFFRAWLERRVFVFDFAVKGSVVGFNTTQDGTKDIREDPAVGGEWRATSA